jgi:PASTA domain
MRAIVLAAALLLIPAPALAQTPSASPSPAAATFHQVFGDVAPEEIPFRYGCDAGLSFTASDLAYGAPPVDPPLVSMAGWQFVGQDGPVAMFVSPPVQPRTIDDAPFQSQVYGLEDGHWSLSGWGDCAPEATFQRQRAFAGYWELAGAPGPDATSFVIRVWDSEGCRGSVRVQGGPRVLVTEEAVLIAMAVHGPPGGDSCHPGRPSRMTINLDEPLGDRVILDAGRLPMPVAAITPSDPGDVAVPDFLCLDLATVRDQAEALGLTLKRRPMRAKEGWRVRDQVPAPGAYRAPGSPITLELSKTTTFCSGG